MTYDNDCVDHSMVKDKKLTSREDIGENVSEDSNGDDDNDDTDDNDVVAGEINNNGNKNGNDDDGGECHLGTARRHDAWIKLTKYKNEMEEQKCKKEKRALR